MKEQHDNNMIMNDPAIRAELRQTALSKYLDQPDTVVLDELSLWQGETRVDVALVNGILHGYEIKSAADTLARLPQQVLIYSSVLDKATVVVAENHLARALDIVPCWWGVELVKQVGDGCPFFETIRHPQDNKSVEAICVAQLLWRDEVLLFLEELDSAKGYRSKPRHILHQRLVQVATLDQIRTRVRHHLKTRIAEKSDGLQPSNGG